MSEVPASGESLVPRTPAQWLEAGREIYREVLKTLARYGVELDSELRVVSGDFPNPYYDPATMTIQLGMPDPGTIQGRMYWIYAARIRGVDSVDGAVAAMVEELPLWITHEVAHHLRGRYGSATGSDFVEEQVVNTLALAFLREHPVYQETLPQLREHFERASARLRNLSPDTAAYLPGFRPDLSGVLVAERELGHKRLEELRLMAKLLGEPLDKLLDEAGVVPGAELTEAETRRQETEVYFNRAYMKNIFEYTLFHMEWLWAYLERDDVPTLGEALETYILTEDWEHARRQETLLLLTTTLRHSDDELAVSAAETLAAEAGQNAVVELLKALDQDRPVLRATILRALGRLAGDDARTLEVAERLMAATEPEVRTAACVILIRSGGDRSGLSILGELLADESTREVVLAAVSGSEDPIFLPVLTDGVDSPRARERILALQGLTLMPLSGEIAQLAASALSSDGDDRVRRAAARCLRTHATQATLTALARALADPAATVREEAADSLRAQGVAAIPTLLDVRGGWRVRAEALLMLHALEAPEAADRIRQLVEELSATAARLNAQRAVLGANAELQGLLRDVLAEEHDKLAQLALRLAGALGNPAGMDLALRGLSSGKASVRETALEMVRMAIPPDFLPALEPLIEPDESGETEDLRHGPGLSTLLDYPEPFLREMAAEALTAASPAVSHPIQGVPMLTTIEKLMFLRAVPMFRAVPLEDLRPLAEDFIVQSYRAGERLFSMGDEGDSLYIITAGRVAIELERPGVSSVRLAELGPGQFFGEAALFDEGPRSASATTLEDTTLLSLARAPFLRFGTREPQIFVEVIRVLSGRLRQTNAALQRSP